MQEKIKKTNFVFRYLVIFTMIFSVIILPGCGGGGGGGGSSDPATATLDPASGETGVERNVVVTATFVDPIVDSDVDNTTFLLKDSADNTVAGTASSVTDVASFDSANNLGVLRTYTASLSSAIEKEAGGPITALNWSFTTRDGVWGGAATIETDDVVSYDPKIVFGPGGVAIAVWRNNADVYANIFDGASWGTAQGIEGTALGVTSLELAVDSNGNALAVWAHYNGSVNDIRASYYDAITTTWSADVAIDGVNTNDANYPKAAFDGFGNAIVVWLQSDGTANSIYTNRYEPSGAGWGSPELLESADGVAYAPAISVDDGGDAIAIWNQDNLAGYDAVYASYYTAGGSWVAQGEIGENVGAGENASNVTIAQDGDGNAIAVWHQLDNTLSATGVWANRYTGGSAGSWGTAGELENPVNSSQKPQIAFDSHGSAMAIWVNWDGSLVTRVRAKIYTLNTGWSTTVNADAGTDDASFPKLAVDSEGHAIVVWRQVSNTVNSIWANRYQAGGTWGTPELLEADDTNSATPWDVAIDSEGNAFAVWAQMDPMATQNKIWVNRFE